EVLERAALAPVAQVVGVERDRHVRRAACLDRLGELVVVLVAGVLDRDVRVLALEAVENLVEFPFLPVGELAVDLKGQRGVLGRSGARVAARASAATACRTGTGRDQ